MIIHFKVKERKHLRSYCNNHMSMIFSAPKCDKMFGRNNRLGLREHFIIHHLDAANGKPLIRNFNCVLCVKNFVSKKSFLLHMATKHEGWSYERVLAEYKQLATPQPALFHKKELKERRQQEATS